MTQVTLESLSLAGVFADDRQAIDWGIEAMLDGLDTPSLRLLAGLPASSSAGEIADTVNATLTEMGLDPPNSIHRVLLRAYAVAHGITVGTVDPKEGVALIHRMAVSPFEHPPSLQTWCDLRSEFVRGEDGDVIEQLAEPALSEAIVAEAERFLSKDLRAEAGEVHDWLSPRESS